MKTMFSKTCSLASLLLALTLTFSCSSDDSPDSGDPSNVSVLPSSGGSSSSVSSSSGPAVCGGVEYDISTQLCHYGALKYYFTDERDGKKYPYVKIDNPYNPPNTSETMTWMAENLNYAGENGDIGVCAANNCDTYGRLYIWADAMANSASSAANPSGVQGLCPKGWHLPSNAEWSKLGNFVAGGGGLQADSDLWKSNCKKGTDVYGFSALPAGTFLLAGSIYGPAGPAEVGNFGWWWTATEENNGAYVRMVDCGGGLSYTSIVKTAFASVRCVQN